MRRHTLSPRLYLLFLPLFLIGLAQGIAALVRLGSLPPVPFSGSISFDEKIRFLKNRVDLKAEILAIGSSMSLNNFAGSAYESSGLAAHSFLNLGSWNSKVRHSFYTYNVLEPIVQPRVVLFVTSVMDYGREERPDQFFNESDVRSYVVSPWLDWLYVLKYDSLSYFANQELLVSRLRKIDDDYSSLKFDQYGEVPLEIPPNKISPERWNIKVSPQDFSDARNYQMLVNWVKKSEKDGTCLVVAQTPLRLSSIPLGMDKQVEDHWKRLSVMLDTDHSSFLNLHSSLRLPDSMFADYSHLNAIGAQIFTKALLERMKDTCARDLHAPASHG